jgi:MFS family permease
VNTVSRQDAVTRARGRAPALAPAASFMVVLGLLAAAAALSTIRRGPGASTGQPERTVSACTLAVAVLLMTAAAAGDRSGRRRAFAIGPGVSAAGPGRRARPRPPGPAR